MKALNNNFICALQDSGFTLYSLSRKTGIPYTTLNNIKLNRTDINHCAYEIVEKIAQAFGTLAEKIVNPVRYSDGIKGKYKNIHYEWGFDSDTILKFEFNGKPVVLHMEKTYTVPWGDDIYRALADARIERYIRDIDQARRLKEAADKWQ